MEEDPPRVPAVVRVEAVVGLAPQAAHCLRQIPADRTTDSRPRPRGAFAVLLKGRPAVRRVEVPRVRTRRRPRRRRTDRRTYLAQAPSEHQPQVLHRLPARWRSPPRRAPRTRPRPLRAISTWGEHASTTDGSSFRDTDFCCSDHQSRRSVCPPTPVALRRAIYARSGAAVTPSPGRVGAFPTLPVQPVAGLTSFRLLMKYGRPSTGWTRTSAASTTHR